MKVRAWLREFRALFLLFVALPVVLGAVAAYAYKPDGFSLPYCIISVVAMMSLHAGTVLLNDYFDYKSGTDVINMERTPYSGGSGLLPEKVLSPRQVLAAGLLCFLLSVSLGLYIVLTRSPVVLLLGMVGVVIGIFYTAPPFMLAYRGLGEIARLIVTPLMALGGFLVQVPVASVDSTQSLALPLSTVIAASLPVAFLNLAALFIFEFPDFEADSAVGKKNLVVRLGTGNAVYLYILLCALAYLSLLAGIIIGLLSWSACLALLALLLSVRSCAGLLRSHDRPKELVPSMKASSDAYILVSIALIVSFFI
jgi:1,4-dihydroxy-2-naphthoate octaprenyltransferase